MKNVMNDRAAIHHGMICYLSTKEMRCPFHLLLKNWLARKAETCDKVSSPRVMYIQVCENHDPCG